MTSGNLTIQSKHTLKPSLNFFTLLVACGLLMFPFITISAALPTEINNHYSLTTSPVDLSFLNQDERPAGKHGLLKAKGEQLIFEDGTQAKFWGVNIAAYALFSSSDDSIKLQAKRLSSLGYNLVRIHHHDSPWVSPNIFGDPSKATSGKIDPSGIAKIDWWIKCLKDEGIYVWLDLHVGRQLKPHDNIINFDEIKDKQTNSVDLKGFNYLNPIIETAMQKFNEEYLNHINPYTGLAYKDEPAIATILITNENDFTNHGGLGFLPNQHYPSYTQIYMDKARAFADRHYLSFNISRFWPSTDQNSLINRLQRKIDRTWMAWEHGPSKLFLNDVEHQFNAHMIKHLKSLGVKVPIVTTSSWGEDGASSLPALTDGDMIDVHSYQNGTNPMQTDPHKQANFINWIAAAQVVNKPLGVSEWNSDPFPSPYRHLLPLYLASQASFQGWDAMMLYAYSQSPFDEQTMRASNWDSALDPSIIATSPIAALLYRRGDVTEAETTYVLDPEQAIFNEAISPYNSVFIRSATERGKLNIAMPSTPALPWLIKSPSIKNAIYVQDKNKSLFAINSHQARTKYNQIMRNWTQGYLTINTPRTQAASGQIANTKITLKDIEITSTTQNVVIAVQSLNTRPIRQSKNLLITFVADSKLADNKIDFYTEPIAATLSISNISKGLNICSNQSKANYPLANYVDGKYQIKLEQHADIRYLFLSEKACLAK
jgi:hypothetical protein